MKQMKKTKFMSMLTLVLLLGAGVMSCSTVKDSDLEETATQIVETTQGAEKVRVSVKDKVATLSGTVEDEATKSSVESSVKAVEGISSVVNNIKVVPPAPVVKEEPAPVEEKKSNQVIVATLKGKLNVHDKPGVQEHVIAVVDHGEVLTLVEKTTDYWWLIRTESGLEGYSNAPYLEEK